MNRMKGLFAVCVLLAFGSASCNYAHPGMYVRVNNLSNSPIHNLEVNYPGGTYGLTTLAGEQTNRRFVVVQSPCKFSFKYQDATGRDVPPKELSLGEKCPKEVEFAFDAGGNIATRIMSR